MTAHNPFKTYPAPFQGAIFFYRFQRVHRACRMIPARRREKRGNGYPVEMYPGDKHKPQDASRKIFTLHKEGPLF
jgi:hypothetical protein